MNQNFTDIMSKRTDAELIEIVSVKRDEYQPEAIQAAEKELESREINLDYLQQVTTDLTAQHAKEKELQSNSVSSWIRFIHFVVDMIAFFLIGFILSLIVELFIPTAGKLIGYLLLIFTFFLYFVFLEYKYQKTIGKFLTKTKVVMTDGRKPDLREIFIRTAYRFFPFDRLSFLFSRNGFHDRFSHTTVIRDKKTDADTG